MNFFLIKNKIRIQVIGSPSKKELVNEIEQGMILCKAPKVFNLEPSSKPCLIFNHFLISVHEKKLMDKCPPEKAFHFSKFAQRQATVGLASSLVAVKCLLETNIEILTSLCNLVQVCCRLSNSDSRRATFFTFFFFSRERQRKGICVLVKW